MKTYFKVSALLFFGTLVIAGCSGNNSTTVVQGVSPVIQSLSIQGIPSAPGGTITVTVVARSAYDLGLTYTWTAYNGWFVTSGGSMPTVTIQAPPTYATDGTVTVQVTDIYHRYAVNVIPVSTFVESLPSITISQQPVITSTTFTCNGYDPLDNALTYIWTVGGLPFTTGNPVLWNSPGIPGRYRVEVSVEDGSSGVAISTTTIKVDSPSPWPQSQRDIEATGQSPIDTSAVTGALKWSTSTISGTTPFFVDVGSPVIGADGTIYVGNYECMTNSNCGPVGYLYALNPTDGSVKWSYPTGGGVSYSPAIGTGGIIYVGSSFTVYAIYPDGKLKWSYTNPNAIPQTDYMDQPIELGADGTVYVNALDSYLYALNPTDGSVKWKHYINVPNLVSPVAIGEDGTLYLLGGPNVGGGAGVELDALNPTDGSVKWLYLIGGGGPSFPEIGADGTIYIADYNNVYAINPDGSPKWQYVTTTANLSGRLAIGANGTLYVGAVDYLDALSITDGTLQWRYWVGALNSTWSPSIGAEGTVYVGTDGYPKNFFAIDSKGGLKWSYTTSGQVRQSPAIGADGTVYASPYHGDGHIYAFH